MQTIRVASRASQLALTQSQQVIDQLAQHNQQISFERKSRFSHSFI